MQKILVLLSLSIVLGCTRQKKGEDNAIAFQTDSIVTNTDISTIKIQYPVFDNQYADTVVKNLIDRQLHLFNETTQEMEISEHWKNELNIRYNVESCNNSLVTVILDQYCFTGGAHGNTIFSKAVMDINRQRKYVLNDFFKGDPLTSIQEPVRKILKQQIDFQDFINDGTSATSDFEIFSLNDSLITFYFTPYQVAPYAYGSQKVALTIKSLPDFKYPD